MLRNLISVAVVSTVTAKNKTPFTIVQENSTHLGISWKTGLNNSLPLYILSNGSKILINNINSSNDTQNFKRNGEFYLELNPCLSHSLCAGDEKTCFSINTTTTDVPENQANLLKNQTQRTNQTLKDENVPARNQTQKTNQTLKDETAPVRNQTQKTNHTLKDETVPARNQTQKTNQTLKDETVPARNPTQMTNQTL